MSLNDSATDAQDLIVDDLRDDSMIPSDDIVPTDEDPCEVGKMIFVFGSNELGKHGAGAARAALDKYNAVYGQGFGPQGYTFAIPTVSAPVRNAPAKLDPRVLAFYVEAFLLYATHHPELTFKVTQLGCGLGGWTADEVAPLFVDAPANCQFDSAWQGILGDNKTYWGTF